MRRLAEVLVRQRWLVLVLPFLVGAVLVTGDGAGGSLVAAAIGAAVVLTAASGLALNLAGFDPAGPRVVADVDATPLGRDLLVRWLSRSRYARFVGGSAGVIVGVGLGDGDLGPALLGLLAGVAVGGALAELHVAGRPGVARRTADLTARRLVDVVPAIDRIAAVALAVAAIIVMVTAPMVGGPGSSAAIRWALASLVVVVSLTGAQRGVVERGRPALDPDLRSADDLLRRLAATQGFARPAIALAAALLAEAFLAIGWGGLALVLWLVGLGWYVASWRTRAGVVGRQAAPR